MSVSELKVVDSPDEISATVSVVVTNTGSLPGREVVQVYLSPLSSSFRRPVRELKAFAKTQELLPGASVTLQLELDKQSFACWDDSKHVWLAEQGEYLVTVARDSTDRGQELKKKVLLPQSHTWTGL
jgi:beta-glucosidase